ncbi:trypsin-like serine protease [Micromonospora sp. NPDC049559]|uniref:trypsin-like serine peptidase n=1 Tax=Micromonospora sp. NPDC049559 TaxID=3155923 RepID=UPI00342E912E
MDVRKGSSPRVLRSLAAAAMLAAAIVTVAPAPAGAAKPAARPDSPTASDGSRVSVGLRAASPGASGYVGTGTPVNPKGTAPDGAPLANVGIESIFGPDDRVRINPTTSYPARAVVMITRNGAAHCTGWLYGPDIVATAGHCVHSGGSGGSWYTGQLTVWPGRNGSSAPYGSCTARTLYSVTGWTSSGDEAYDYGAIKLNCTIGYTVGWFGYWWQAASLAGTSTLINGYPGEKPFGEQWRGDSVARTVAVSQTNQIFYSNDTTGGMSGSPVYQNRPAGSSFCVGICSMAIHAYGFPHGAYPHNTYNHGTRITEARFNNLQAWKAAA